MAEIARSRVGVTTVLVPGGALAEDSIDDLRAAVDACMAARETEITLDLGAVPYASSEGLELLLETQERLGRIGGSLRAQNTGTVLRDVFRVTGLDERFEVVDTEGELSTPEPRPQAHQRIGEILVERGLVDEATIEKALDLQRETGDRMAQILVDKGWLPEKQLLQALSTQLGVPFLWVRAGAYDGRVVRQIELDVLRRLAVLPLFRIADVVYLATSDPQSIPSMEAVEDRLGCRVRPVLACSEEIRVTAEEAHGAGEDLAEYLGDLEGDLEVVEERVLEEEAIDEAAAGSPVVNLINGVIQRAVRDGASDVHLEPGRSRCRIRLRVDGALYTIMQPPMEIHPALVSRLKVMAGLDIAERRLPQDGRIQVVTRGRVVDLRFSSLPGILGEKIVLRVLDKHGSVVEVEKLGLSDGNLEAFRSLLRRSYGLLLVTGPTGSGKTTSLYAALHYLNSEEKNIVTIEDPVEYQIDTISQNQVRENIGLGFARMLKHVLRQDPDIVMVGEIRERETAQIAVQAALTGHLVLSTLHTNDSVGAVTRMVDMGIEPYLLASALVGVVAQRLVRTVCSECRTQFVAPPNALPPCKIEVPEQVRLTRGRGCPACYDSGYRGRRAIHEVVACEAELQELIVRNPSRHELDAWMEQTGVRRLLDDGVARAIEGETTVEEVLRVVNA